MLGMVWMIYVIDVFSTANCCDFGDCELPTACSSWLKPEQASTRNRELYGGQTCQTSNKYSKKWTSGTCAYSK